MDTSILGEATAGPIMKDTGLQNSVLHLALNKLVERGFASYVSKGMVRHYRPADPKSLFRIMEERRARFEAILPELLSRHKSAERNEAEIYEGFRGLKTMSHEIINGAKKGDEYLYFAFHADNPDEFDNVYNFYREFEIERKKLGIVLKGIAPRSIRRKYKGRDTRKVKFVNFPVPTNVAIFKDRVSFTPWEDGEVSFLIYSRHLADSFRRYFYSIYKK